MGRVSSTVSATTAKAFLDDLTTKRAMDQIDYLKTDQSVQHHLLIFSETGDDNDVPSKKKMGDMQTYIELTNRNNLH